MGLVGCIIVRVCWRACCRWLCVRWLAGFLRTTNRRPPGTDHSPQRPHQSTASAAAGWGTILTGPDCPMRAHRGHVGQPDPVDGHPRRPAGNKSCAMPRSGGWRSPCATRPAQANRDRELRASNPNQAITCRKTRETSRTTTACDHARRSPPSNTAGHDPWMTSSAPTG
jgi:hypothetical protein